MRAPEVALGIMSGTSGDGVDAALVRVRWDEPRPTIELRAHRHVPFTAALRERVLGAAEGHAVAAHDLARLHGELGDAYAEAAIAVMHEASTRPSVIGVHGQTVAHLPAEGVTWQLGDAARVAVRTRIPVVCDFRSADVAAGGEGAPLTPFADHLLFGGRAPCAVLNLGGIANLTLIPSDDADTVRALDTGPGNMVIDALARGRGQDHDVGGEGARRGRVHDAALASALAHPFFSRRGPKSAGREEFGGAVVRALLDAIGPGGSLDDALATATELTARTVADALRAHTPAGVTWREVLVGGGGARNGALMDALRRVLAPAEVAPTDDAGVPSAAREAIAFALLALYRLHGRPNTLPRCTGATHAVSAGAIHAPRIGG